MSLDLITAKLAIEPIEDKYGRFKDGFTTSAPFLTELAAAFVGMGIDPCTPTMAFAVWEAICNRLEDVKKNTNAAPK